MMSQGNRGFPKQWSYYRVVPSVEEWNLTFGSFKYLRHYQRKWCSWYCLCVSWNVTLPQVWKVNELILKCLAGEFQRFCKFQVDGENTLAENIADNGAIKTSYEAFQKHEEANGPGQRLPGLVQYNSKQLFFLNLAQVCSFWAYEESGQISSGFSGQSWIWLCNKAMKAISVSGQQKIALKFANSDQWSKRGLS